MVSTHRPCTLLLVAISGQAFVFVTASFAFLLSGLVAPLLGVQRILDTLAEVANPGRTLAVLFASTTFLNLRREATILGRVRVVRAFVLMTVSGETFRPLLTMGALGTETFLLGSRRVEHTLVVPAQIAFTVAIC